MRNLSRRMLSNPENRQTLVHVVAEYSGKVLEKAFEVVYNNKEGIILAGIGTVVYAIGHGFNHPIDTSHLSNPNFVQPGKDFNWDLESRGWGMAISAGMSYLDNFYYNAAAIVGGGVVQAGLRKLSQIRVKHREQ